MKEIFALPFQGLEKISDLMEFDGPILSHFQDNTGTNILFYWVDYTLTYNRWLVFAVEQTLLDRYKKGHVSLRTVVESTASSKFFYADINDKVQYVGVRSLFYEEINPQYMPELNSFLIPH